LNNLQNTVLIENNNGEYDIIDSILRYWLKNYHKEKNVYPHIEVFKIIIIINQYL